MGFAHSLKGMGTVIAGGQRYENVPYNISVSTTGRGISGAGTVMIEDIPRAMEIFETSTITLDMGGDRSITLVCSGYSPPNPFIEVMTSGPIPGF